MRFRNYLNTGKNPRRFIVYFVIILLLIFYLVKLLTGINWDGKRRFTVVINSQPALVLSLEPQKKRAAIFTIPPNTLLEIPFGYGTYPAQSVYQLGELDPKRGGGRLLSKAVENTFGVWVDGYLAFRDNFPLPTDFLNHFPLIKKQYFSFFGALQHLPQLFSYKRRLVTNLTFLDQLYLWIAFRNLRSDQITILDFEKSGAFKDNNLPDGSAVKTIDIELAAIVLTDQVEDRQLRSENISLEIVNAAGVDRLATQFAQILTNLGARVIIKSTSEVENNFSCIINLSNNILKNTMIVKRLTTYYHCQIKDDTEEKGTVQLRIILGKEFNQW